MYGLLVENLASFIRVQWGESKWDMVRKNAGIDAPSFSIHHVYPETLLNKLAKSAFQVLGVDDKSFFEAMGIYFVEYVGQYGYDAMLTVLGRHLRDFLNGLDNLHEYLKFSYTKMRAPSFYCDSETANGLRLHYRSRRRGFVFYVMGQIKQVARHFYNQDCEVEILSESLDGETMHTIFQLTFDNDAFSEEESLKSMIRKEQQLPIRASIIFELFPFCIVFNEEMNIKFTGHALLTILKDLVGQCMTEAFEIVKPLISFCFGTILERRNNIFELITTAPIKDDEALTGSLENDDDEESGTRLRLRGQMMHMEDWGMIIFLANPVMETIENLIEAGLFINDLSLHDCSRDLVLAGTQQSVELKLALDQEQHKSKKLEESMKKLDEEMKRTDELLYQMIPKTVADRIRKGENPVDTCEVHPNVSILFSDVVTFTDICSRITPFQVVAMLNHMYSLFDQLTERNGVYKVETIGDSYMVVSGAPEAMENHAERICDMAMDMVDAMQVIQDPSRDGESLKIRVGCHSGTVVSGVVGIKMPRYCLFGDAVNTASRMESTSEGGKIQISTFCKEKLPPPYQTERRGTVPVKGKGEMETFWLLGREARVPLSKLSSKAFNWSAPVSHLAEKEAMAKTGGAESTESSGPPTSIVKGPDPPKEEPPAATTRVVKQPTIDKASLASIQQTISKPSSKSEPPVAISEEKAEPNATVAKPTAQSPSAFAASGENSSDGKTTPKPTATLDNPPRQERRASMMSNSAPSPSKTLASDRSSAEKRPSLSPSDITTAAPIQIRRSSSPIPVVEITNDTANDTNPQTLVNGDTEAGDDSDKLKPDYNSINEFIENDISPNDPNSFRRKSAMIFDGINGIRKGSQEFRRRVKEKDFSTATMEAMTDMGCSEFAAKQKEVISKACVLL